MSVICSLLPFRFPSNLTIALIERDLKHPEWARRRDTRYQYASHIVVARRGFYLPAPLMNCPVKHECKPSTELLAEPLIRPQTDFVPHRIPAGYPCYTHHKLHAHPSDHSNTTVDLYV